MDNNSDTNFDESETGLIKVPRELISEFFDKKLDPIMHAMYLKAILGFTRDERGVIYDEDGDEFYADDEMDIWDLNNNLQGILNYYKHSCEERGKRNKEYQMQKDFKKLMGL